MGIRGVHSPHPLKFMREKKMTEKTTHEETEVEQIEEAKTIEEVKPKVEEVKPEVEKETPSPKDDEEEEAEPEKPKFKEKSETEAVFKGDLDIGKLKQVGKALYEMVDECSLHIEKDRFHISSMDSSQVALIDIRMGKDDFHDFALEGLKGDAKELEIGLDVNSLNTYLKPMKDEKANLKMSDTFIEMDTSKDGFNRHLLIRAINSDSKPPKLPVIDYDTEFKITKSALNKVCKEADAIDSNYIAITVKGNGVVFLVENDSDKLDIFLPTRNESYLKYGVLMTNPIATGEVKATFGTSYIKKVIAGAKEGDITMKMGNEKPAYFEYGLDKNTEVGIWIAPRIENV